MVSRQEFVVNYPKLNCRFQTQRAFRKMPILAQLSRRFHGMLTTDAKPDPPRIRIDDYTHNLPPQDKELRKTQSDSVPIAAPENEHDVVTSTQESAPNDATKPADSCADAEDLGDAKPTSESKEYKRPRTKTKSKQSKCCKLGIN